jgi:hypothetical protein
MTTDPRQLDIRTVQMILSHLTQELREQVPEGQRAAVQSEEEARQAVATLLQETRTASVSPAELALSDEQADVAARETLGLLLNDPETEPKVRALLVRRRHASIGIPGTDRNEPLWNDYCDEGSS